MSREAQVTAKEMREQVCRWVGPSGDGESRESPRASGGTMENGNEGAWGTGSVAGMEGHIDRL